MKLDISFSNLFKYSEIDAVGFTFMGMGIVFTGLVIISLYIAFLPHFLVFLGKRKRYKRHRKVYLKMKAKSGMKTDNTRSEIMAAVAMALHLHSNYEDDKQKITWTDDEPSAWHTAGKIQALNQSHTIFSRRPQYENVQIES